MLSVLCVCVVCMCMASCVGGVVCGVSGGWVCMNFAWSLHVDHNQAPII